MYNLFTFLMAIIFTASILPAQANGPAANLTHVFKSDNPVALEVERGKGEVLIHIYVRDFKSYDEITIERGSDASALSQVKLINPAAETAIGDYVFKVDKFPLSGQMDSYYRIKTLSKEGILRMYPAEMLPAISRK